MVVLLVALTFGLCFLIDRLTNPKPKISNPKWIQPDQAFQKTLGDEHHIAGYRLRTGVLFHPGHMWVKQEGRDRARIGLDDFICQLNTPIKTISCPAHHTLIQGAPCLRLQTHTHTIDILAPIGGEIIAINNTCFQHPTQILTDPFEAWLLIVENKHLLTERNNLIQGEWIFVWHKQEGAQLHLRKRMGLPIDNAFLNTFFGREAVPCSGH